MGGFVALVRANFEALLAALREGDPSLRRLASDSGTRTRIGELVLFTRQLATVITSYSIHYTKLYEHTDPISGLLHHGVGTAAAGRGNDGGAEDRERLRCGPEDVLRVAQIAVDDDLPDLAEVEGKIERT